MQAFFLSFLIAYMFCVMDLYDLADSECCLVLFVSSEVLWSSTFVKLILLNW